MPIFRRQQYNPSDSQNGSVVWVEFLGLEQVAEDTESLRKWISAGSVLGVQTVDPMFPGDLIGSSVCFIG